jgi:ABC-type transporter Mla subunit MlaD
MNKLFLSTVILLLSLLFCCSEEKYDTYFIQTKNADQIKIGTELLDRGISIGHVADIELTLNNVLLQIQVSKSYKIDKETNWYLGTQNLTTRTINLNRPSKVNSSYSPGDTLKIDLDFLKYKIKS